MLLYRNHKLSTERNYSMNITVEQAKIIAQAAKDKLDALALPDSEMFLIEEMANSHGIYAQKHYGKISDSHLMSRLSSGFVEGLERITKKIKWDGKEPAALLGALSDYVYAEILCRAPSLCSAEGFGKKGKSAMETALKDAFEYKSFEDLPIEISQTEADQMMVDVRHMKKKRYGDYGGITALLKKHAENTASPRETAQLLCEYQTLFKRQKTRIFYRFFENKKRARLLNEMEAILLKKYPDTDLINTDPNSILGRVPYKAAVKKLNELIATQGERLLSYLPHDENASAQSESTEECGIAENIEAEVATVEEVAAVDTVDSQATVTVEQTVEESVAEEPVDESESNIAEVHENDADIEPVEDLVEAVADEALEEVTKETGDEIDEKVAEVAEEVAEVAEEVAEETAEEIVEDVIIPDAEDGEQSEEPKNEAETESNPEDTVETDA